MSDASSMVEPALPFEAPASTGVPVEAVMDSHRIRGELRLTGVPRRLVDILNSIDGGYVLIHGGQVDDPLKPGDGPRRLSAIQLLRDAILFIMPRGGAPPSDPFERVKKTPVPATIVVPGFEISGNVHLMPNVDPTGVPLIGTHHFIPVTDATISAGLGRSEVWQEPIVLVNLARALAYGPRKV